MNPTTDFDIVGSYNNQIVSTIDSERSVNLFEYTDPRGKKKKSLINTSGLTNTNSVFPGSPTGGFRGEFVFNNNLYYVIGNSVYQETSSGLIILLGNLVNSVSGYVGIEANTFQVIFVDGQNGYIWDTTTNKFVMITDPAFPAKPIDVCYLDGFFTVINGGTNNFELSTFNQGLVWGADNSGTPNTFTMAAGSPNIVISFVTGTSIANYQIGTPIVFTGGSLPVELVTGTTYYVKSLISATTITVSATNGGTAITSAAGGSGSLTNNGQLQLASITTHPGTIVACRTLHRRIFFFSQFFTEVWENAGLGANLPFRRNNSLLMEFGTPCIGSISVSFDMMVFLSQTRDGLGAVMQVTGTQSIPISTSALDAQLSTYASNQQVSDCRGFLIKENNIIFYRMNFTAANHTFVYNVSQSDPTDDSTKRWHEEEVLGGDRHPSQTHAYFNGQNYVGHYSLPILYIVDTTNYTNDGQIIRRQRITKPFYPEGGQRIRIDRIQIDLLQGTLSQLQTTFEELDLYTENGFIIETESGIDIALEQSLPLNSAENIFVYLSISKDGGQTYGYQAKSPMGNLGQRTFRTVWRKQGTSKRGQALVFKFEFYDPIPFMVMGATWAKEILPE